MFGYVIQIRDTLIVIGICCVIAHIVIFIANWSTIPGTNWREAYDLLLNFSSWFILAPGILFIIVYFLLVARIGSISGNAKKVSQAKQSKRV